MAWSRLIEHVARRRDTNAKCASATAAPARLERYIAEIPPERYGRSAEEVLYPATVLVGRYVASNAPQ